MKSQAVKRAEAEARQAEYDKLAYQEKVDRIYSRPGQSHREYLRVLRAELSRNND